MLQKKERCKVRILILSVTAGQGHNRTAKGVADFAQSRGHECRIVDTFEYISPAMGELVDEGYRLSIALTPKAYRAAFRSFERAEQEYASILKAYKSVAMRMSAELEGVYREFRPDVVVCTMSFTAQIATAIYERGICAAPRIGIVTDYTLHPFWLGTNLNALVTPSDQLTERFVSRGIDRSIIRPVGIPISLDFARHMDRQAACDSLGIDNMPTLLLMAGSTGYGDISRVIENIDRIPSLFQILVVCGSNKRMENKLRDMQTRKPMRVYGYTDQVHVMMSASDMIVTKPGGLTVSEAVAKKLPMVLINPIPGQEERNMDFLTNFGMAMRANRTLPVDEAVAQLMMSSVRRRLMSQAQEVFGKPNATADVYAILEEMVNR